MNPVEQEWQNARNELIAATSGFEHVVCSIPGWDLVDLPTGLNWLQQSIYEGWYVRHRVLVEGTEAIVQFKTWEYGTDEPEFGHY